MPEKGCGAADDSDPEDRMPIRSITWQNAAWVINASVIGMGVLTIPSCFATLGWLAALVALVTCLLANVLVAHIMMEIQELHPMAITMADAAQIASGGSRTVKVVFRTILYGEKMACTCAFLNLMADTLGSAFYSVHWCEVTWCGLLIILFLPLMQIKSLQETFFLNLVNFGTIVVVVVLTCIKLWMLPRTEDMETTLLPAANFRGIFGAISMLVFAYSGNWMYFELMAEMKEPRKFLKAFTIAGPTQLTLYAVMGCACYAARGRSVAPSVVEALPFGPVMRLISLVLLVHIICGTGTNMVVLIRFFHSRVSPQDVNADTTRANFIRTMLYFMIITGALLVALCVNGFGTIVTLIGAIFEAPINFICPFVLYAGIMHGRPPRKTWSSRFVWLGAFIIALFGACTMVFGILDAATHMKTFGASRSGGLFSCSCQGLWDTCECSASRMPVGTCPNISAFQIANDRNRHLPPMWPDTRVEGHGGSAMLRAWDSSVGGHKAGSQHGHLGLFEDQLPVRARAGRRGGA